jgi:DNA-binding FadR family transcriptional regulator
VVTPALARTAKASRSPLAIALGDQALRQLKTSERVARDIVDDIVTRRLEPGDGLSSEAAMLREYEVSRESLREALRLLEVQGLITLRRGPGGGPIVGQVDPANLGRTSTLYYHLAGATYAELFDAWVVAETYIAQLATRNPDRDRVRRTMAPFREPPEAHDDVSLAQFVHDHSAFHAALGSLAENRVMQISLRSIGQIVTHHVVVNADPRDAAVLIEHDHQAIARAVVAGHANKAHDLMEGHIRAVVRFYEDELGPQLDDYIEWH